MLGTLKTPALLKLHYVWSIVFLSEISRLQHTKKHLLHLQIVQLESVKDAAGNASELVTVQMPVAERAKQKAQADQQLRENQKSPSRSEQ